jgi:hypothetical protein
MLFIINWVVSIIVGAFFYQWIKDNPKAPTHRKISLTIIVMLVVSFGLQGIGVY